MSKHVPLNFVTNLLVFIITILVNLFMTPFYIKTIGIDGLGVLRLALMLPVYINLIMLIISGTVSRFLTIDIQRKEFKNAIITFNTSFFSISSLLLITLPIIIYLSINITSFLEIPQRYTMDATYLFLGVFLSSQIIIFSALFLIPAYAENRIDVQNYIKIIVLCLQTSLIFLMFTFLSVKISYIGYAYFIAAFIALIISLFIWKKFAPFLNLSISAFRFEVFKKIASMGSWLLINQVGSILFLSIDLLIINYFFGSNETGKYSIVLQWSILLRGLATMVVGVITPLILISYAKKNYSDIIIISEYSVKFMGIFIAIPIGLILGFAQPLLTLWVGSEFISLIPLLWVLILHLLINLAVLPLFSIYTAYNKVKIPGIVSLVFGIVNLILAITLSVGFEYGIYGVAFAGAIVLTLKNSIFIPIYAAKILDLNIFTFFIFLKNGIFVFISTYLISQIYYITGITTWSELMIYIFISLLCILIFIWKVVLNNNDKYILKNKIKKKESYV